MVNYRIMKLVPFDYDYKSTQISKSDKNLEERDSILKSDSLSNQEKINLYNKKLSEFKVLNSSSKQDKDTPKTQIDKGI